MRKLIVIGVLLILGFLFWSAWRFIQRDSCLDVGGWWRHDENRCEYCYDDVENYVGGPYCEEPPPTDSLEN